MKVSRHESHETCSVILSRHNVSSVDFSFYQCDEQKPCSNCARHGVPCSLITDGPNASQLPNAVPSSSSSASTAPNPKLPAQKKVRATHLPLNCTDKAIGTERHPAAFSTDRQCSQSTYCFIRRDKFWLRDFGRKLTSFSARSISFPHKIHS